MYFAKKAFCIVLLFMLLSITEGYSTIIKGRVIDSKGNQLPFATVFLEGTTIGTTANGKGDFELQVTAGLYKIVCQIIGYKQESFNVSITWQETILHDFILHEQTLEIKEIEIHANAEDPAYKIIRHAIERRKFHLEQVKSFQSSIYLKVVGRSRNLPDKFMGKKIKTPDLDVDSSGKGVLYLMEEYADYYSDKGQEQTIIHSVHESGDINGMGLAKLPPVLTFYENNIKIFSSRGSISPISENAIFYYKYKYLGQFTESGRTINKIEVTQRRDFEPCFNGFIYITDDDWAIHSLDLTLVKSSGINLFDTVKISQQFLPVKQDKWVIKNQLIYMTAKIFAFDIVANASSLYNNQKINEPIPDTIFHSKIVSRYDVTANKKDSTYWKETRPLPLQNDEVKNFAIQDSLNKKVQTKEYLDSTRIRSNRIKPIDFLIAGKTINGKENKNTFGFNSLLFLSNFNAVEGVNFAPKFTWNHMIDTGKIIHTALAVRYGLSNTHLNGIGKIYYALDDKHWRGKKWVFGIEGGKYVFQYSADNPVYPIMNSISALFWHENDMKIYERKDLTAFVSRKYGNGIAWYSKISYHQRIPLNNTTEFSFENGKDDHYDSNLPNQIAHTVIWQKNNATLINFNITWRPGCTYIQYPDYKMPQQGKMPKFSLSYDKGIPGLLNSTTDFDKYKFSVTDELRLKLLGTLAYNISIGGFLNSTNVSAPDLEHPFGNHGIGFASPYLESFQFMQYYAFSNKENLYSEVHLEYKLNGLLSNKVPALRQAQLHLVLGGNAFYVSNTNYYTEAFVGIDNIGWKAFRLFRLDFVQSWDSYLGRNSGIRLGISSSNGFSINLNKNDEAKSEW